MENLFFWSSRNTYTRLRVDQRLYSLDHQSVAQSPSYCDVKSSYADELCTQ